MSPCHDDGRYPLDDQRQGVHPAELAHRVAKMPRRRELTCLLWAAVLSMTGCASTTVTRDTSVTYRSAKVLAPLEAQSTPASPCPPETAGRPLERDLTVPFSHRAYLLDSGEFCRPAPMASNGPGTEPGQPHGSR